MPIAPENQYPRSFSITSRSPISIAARSVFDALAKSGLTARDARAVTVDYASACYSLARGWKIRINPLFDVSALSSAGRAVDTSPLDGFPWAAESPLVLSHVFENCLDAKLRKAGCVYTPELSVAYICRSTVAGALGRDTPSGWESGWNSLCLGEIAVERSIAKLKNAQNVISTLRVLDPCCGCGNFLYGMLHELVAIDQAIVARLHKLGEKSAQLSVTLKYLHGMDIDPDAVEISKRVIQLAAWELGLLSDASPQILVARTLPQCAPGAIAG